MTFDEAMKNCCCCCDEEDPMAGFKEPDLYRYFASPMVDDRFGPMVSTVDFDVQETKKGIRTITVSNPLVSEPDPFLSSYEPKSLRFVTDPELSDPSYDSLRPQGSQQPEGSKRDKSGGSARKSR